jgi:exopolyphosphatase/guanosine-5'-triphosphate,3'-diphosphate pyrophosphatase
MALDHFGAIDIGTNAARLFIGYVQGKKQGTYIKKVSLTRGPLRLGEDVFSSGEISNEKLQRFEATMIAFKHLMHAFEVKAFRACATSAMREATNGEDIRNYLLQKTGVNIEVIPGDEEANIIFSNFFTGGYDKNQSYLFIDVGGGSTELTILKEGTKINSRSFPLGTLRILKNRVTENTWTEIHEWIAENTKKYDLNAAVGTGGNINKIFKLLEKKTQDPIHIYELESMTRYLSGMSLEDRMDKFQLKPDRADVIVPAGQIYHAVMQNAGIDKILVPKTGLADALIYQLWSEHQN